MEKTRDSKQPPRSDLDKPATVAAVNSLLHKTLSGTMRRANRSSQCLPVAGACIWKASVTEAARNRAQDRMRQQDVGPRHQTFPCAKGI